MKTKLIILIIVFLLLFPLLIAQIKQESVSAKIIITMFEEGKGEYQLQDIKTIRLEIYKIEDEKENLIGTLIYNNSLENYTLNVEPGYYKIREFFGEEIIEKYVALSDGEVVVVPLYGTTYTHQYIIKEAKKIWAVDEISNYISDDETMDLVGENNDITEGSYEEDYHPEWCNHFWEADDSQGGIYNHGLDDFLSLIGCLGEGDSSYFKAQYFWNTEVIPNYPLNKERSYYYLGRVAHLLEDSCVPAHMHLDIHTGIIGGDEALEEFLEKTGYYGPFKNYENFKGSDYPRKYYRYEELFFPECVKTNPTNLFKLFWYTAQKTEYYASDDWDAEHDDGISGSYIDNYYSCENGDLYYFPGGENNQYLWESEINKEGVGIIYSKDDIEDESNEGPNLAKIAQANIPHAMKAVAGLYRLFWLETHNVSTCEWRPCCDRVLGITYEYGEQPYEYDDEFFCMGNEIYIKDYYCNGPSPDPLFKNVYDKTCGEDYCEDWGNNYCKDDNLYHSRTCYTKGCLLGECYSNSYAEEELITECSQSCEENKCKDFCTISSPSDNSIYPSRRILFNITTSERLSEISYIDYSNSRPRWRTLCIDCDGYEIERGFPEGEHDVKIKCVPYVGGDEIHEVKFTNDYREPKISQTLPKENSFTNGSNFYIRYSEENVKEISMTFNPTQNLINCPSGKNQECSIDLDLTGYNNPEIEYYFTITDMAGNTAESNLIKVKVDTTPPIIENPDSFYEKKGGYIYFNIDITEDNFDRVSYSYIDSKGRLKEKKLCSKLKSGKCVKKVRIKDGEGNRKIIVMDEAGNRVEKIVV